MVVEHRAREIRNDFLSVENSDMVRRWGRLQLFGNYGMPLMRNGLSPDQLRRLPSTKLKEDVFDDPCSICLEDMKTYDDVRKLDSCQHIFHKSCIDLWLLRDASCPNCKGRITAPGVPVDECPAYESSWFV
eukprot:GHVU01092135.1.p1 GENE.GHVU01092135.1~~GHVU01092135.1.p1  ORF type:complete len:131 (+),score=21.09 GHVU01092135.1:82-474(+)